MTRVERKAIEWIEKHKLWLFAGIISILAAVLRYNGLTVESGDYTAWYGPWFYTIKDNGGFAAVSQQVGDYNVLFQAIIALMTYFPFYPMYMYKALFALFDFVQAAVAGWLIYEVMGRDKFRGVLGYAALLLLPTVFIGSAWYTQCDSIYTTFILLGILLLLKKRDILAFVAFGIAFQFKLQAIFVFPFLLYYYVSSKRFSLLNFLIIPAVSTVVCVLCGRSPFAWFEIYMGQAQYYSDMAYNFPSIWNLISRHGYLFESAAIMLTIGMLGVGLLIMMQRKKEMDSVESLKWCMWTLWTVVLFLPAMHERYAYTLGVLLVIAAVINPKLLGYVALFEVTILVGYVRFMWKDTVPAQVSDYARSVVFLMGYLLFACQNFVFNDPWISSNKE